MSRGAVWRALSAENAATEPEREPAGGISVVGGLIVLGVMVGVVLLGLWLESKRGQARHAERVRRGAG